MFQSRKKIKTTWSIVSLDLILGLVGGITSIVWVTLGLLLSPYEEFKFNASLAGSVYPTSPQKDEDEAPVDSRQEATQILEGTVSERGKLYYKFSEYHSTWFLDKCCCCFLRRDSRFWRSRIFKYKRYEKAIERLTEEIDILKHISSQRLSQFMAKLILRKH